MDITLERSAFAKALAQVARIVERRNTVPILSNLALSTTAYGMMIAGTDLDLHARTVVAGQIGEPGSTTVPAATLTDIVRKLPEGSQVQLRSKGDTAIEVKSGRSRFTLQTLPIEDFPDLAAGVFSHRFDMPAKTLARIISQIDFAISTEETRYYLNGIHLHTLEVAGKPMLRAVATDGHRMARMEIDAPEGAAGLPGIIIPRKTVSELARMAKETEGDFTVEISDKKIRVSAGSAGITSKLIDGTFPDYQRVIPIGNDKVATLERTDFAAAVDRVGTVSSERGRAVKLSFSSQGLALSVTSPDSGSAEETVEADFDAAPIDIGFNAKYLAEVLGTIEADTVQVKLADGGSPSLFQPREGAELLVVLMPMRV